MTHVALLGAGDGIENLGPVQAEHGLTSRSGRPVLYGLVLLAIAHDVRGDAALFRQLCVFSFRGSCVKASLISSEHSAKLYCRPQIWIFVDLQRFRAGTPISCVCTHKSARAKDRPHRIRS